MSVPSGPQRREGLPRALPAGQLTVLVESCDRATPSRGSGPRHLDAVGQAGLRCGEVAGLALNDLDWRVGELVVHGKRSQTDRLPLPYDVGKAISDYLSWARPSGFGRTGLPALAAPSVPCPGWRERGGGARWPAGRMRPDQGSPPSSHRRHRDAKTGAGLVGMASYSAIRVWG